MSVLGAFPAQPGAGPRWAITSVAGLVFMMPPVEVIVEQDDASRSHAGNDAPARGQREGFRDPHFQGSGPGGGAPPLTMRTQHSSLVCGEGLSSQLCRGRPPGPNTGHHLWGNLEYSGTKEATQMLLVIVMGLTGVQLVSRREECEPSFGPGPQTQGLNSGH